jgi:hypothetical protein
VQPPVEWLQNIWLWACGVSSFSMLVSPALANI